MTRSSGFETPILVKVVSIVAAAAIFICAITAIATTSKISKLNSATSSSAKEEKADKEDKADKSDNKDAAPTTAAPAAAPATQAPADAQAPSGEGSSSADAPAASGGTVTDTAQVLTTYTDIMNKLKTDGKSIAKLSYNYVGEYDLGAANAVIGPVLKGMMTMEEDAEEVVSSDMVAEVPITHNQKGCLLTDPKGVASGSITDNGDGTSTLVLVTVSEDNAEPAAEGAGTSPSYTGGIFAPMSAKGVDETVAKIPTAKVENLVINYHDCTATVKYKTDTLEAIDVYLDMPMKLSASIKLAIIPIEGFANIGYVQHLYNIQY